MSSHLIGTKNFAIRVVQKELNGFESHYLHQTLTNTNTGVKKAFYVFRRGVFGIICKR